MPMPTWVMDFVLATCWLFFVLPELAKARSWFGRIWWGLVSIFYVYVFGISKWW